MKKIVGINDAIKSLEGVDIKEGDKIVTVKRVLLNLIGSIEGKAVNNFSAGEQSIRILNLGLSLVKSGDDFEFEEQDQSILIQILEENKLRYFATVIAQVYNKVKYAEEFKK